MAGDFGKIKEQRNQQFSNGEYHSAGENALIQEQGTLNSGLF